jgi:hypothetical protein
LSADLETRAVDDEGDRLRSRPPCGVIDAEGLVATGKRGVVGHAEVEAGELEDGRDESLGCAQRKVEKESEREDRLNGDIGVDPLSTAVALRHRRPAIAGFLADPHGDVTASSEGLFILRPVSDSILRLVLRVTTRSLLRFGH